MRSFQQFFSRQPFALGALAVSIFLALIAMPSTASADDAGSWLSKAFTKSSNSGGYSGLGGPVPEGSGKRRRGGTQVASLGGYAPSPSFGSGLSGGGGGRVKWAASSSCLNSQLTGVINSVSSYGSVTVSSTCRSHSHNASVGGAKKSHHLTGDAADFRVHGNVGAAYAHLRSIHGGQVKHYGGGLFHIDTGAKGRF